MPGGPPIRSRRCCNYRSVLFHLWILAKARHITAIDHVLALLKPARLREVAELKPEALVGTRIVAGQEALAHGLIAPHRRAFFAIMNGSGQTWLIPSTTTADKVHGPKKAGGFQKTTRSVARSTSASMIRLLPTTTLRLSCV